MSVHEGWRAFFDGHAPAYMQNVLRLPSGARLLDLGCGTGRHSVALVGHGFRVVGVDLSRGMLRQAQLAALEAEARVVWIQADATRFAAPQAFDAAICLCEGAFGLIGAGEDPQAHDAAIARNLARSLRPGGRLVLTASNGLRFLAHYGPEAIARGDFDPATLTERVTMEWTVTGRKTCRRSFPEQASRSIMSAAGPPAPGGCAPSILKSTRSC
jgi:SAM-dependent methyltransferase